MNVEVVGELISKPYIKITLAMMERFWSRCGNAVTGSSFAVAAGVVTVIHKSPGKDFVEGDASSAS